MESKISEVFSKLKNSDSKLKILIAIGLISVFLIAFSETMPKIAEQKKTDDTSYSDYISELENKTCELVSSINGAGNCKVMITLKVTNESVYAKNSNENSNNGSFSNDSEYVLYNGQSGEEPLLIKEYFPEIQGVAIVCDGADNTVVKEEIINAVSSLFNISVSKISVSKLKG